MILYKKDDHIFIQDIPNGINGKWIPSRDFTYDTESETTIRIVAWEFNGNDYKNFINCVYLCSTITDRFGVSYGTTPHDVIFGVYKGIDANIIERSTDSVFARFNKVTDSTTLAIDAVFTGLSRDIEVVSATGAAIGSYIVLFHPASERFTTFFAINVVGTTITLDSPLDFAYPAGTFVDIAITNMAVNGSVTPQIFGLRGTGAPPGVDIDYHQTRMIFQCLTASPVSLSEFADIPALTNGLVFRTRDGRYHNEWNVKSNADLAGLMYDWSPYAALNPQQGQDGYIARLTTGGDEKLGIVIDLPLGQDAELIIQDDLTAITSLVNTSMGHIKVKA